MLKKVVGKKVKNFSKKELLKISSDYSQIVFDLGCGDGKFLYQQAQNHPKSFFIGLEPAIEQLEKISQKASKKPAKGGLPNIIYLQSSFEEINKNFEGLADIIYINFPWAGLLEYVVKGSAEFKKKISLIAKDTFELVIYFTYDQKFEGEYIKERKLPKVDSKELEKKYSELFKSSGFKTNRISVTNLKSGEMEQLHTSWGKKITDKRGREIYILRAVYSTAGLSPRISIPSEKRLSYSFHAYGHPNILATHVKTLEFTKDKNLTERGDCIIGVNSDFDLNELKKFSKKVKFIVSVIDPQTNETITSEFKTKVNSKFASEHELVLRKSFFESDRTFGYGLNRGANWLDRKIVELLKDTKTKATISVVEGWY